MATLMCSLLNLFGQENVGIGTLTPASDAILDLMTNNKGLLVPRVTTAERNAIPTISDGLIVYDTDESKFFYWNKTAGQWQNELITAATFNAVTKTITISDVGSINNLDLNILSQVLSFSNDTLYISDKNGIYLGEYHKDSSITNELILSTLFNTSSKNLSITDAGRTFNSDLSILSQTLSFNNDILYISDQNNIYLGEYHKDSSITNELITNTTFNTTNKNLSITDAGQTFNNDLGILSQTLDLTNDVLSISDQNNVNLSIYHKDSSASNEIQGLSTSNDTIFMDRGGFAKLTDTDFWNTDGNTGTNPTANFIGTRDNNDFVLRTNNVENMRIKNTGNVGIGTPAPDEKLDVFGNIELSGGNRTVQTQVMTANGTGFSLTVKASDNQNNGFNAQNGGSVIIQGGKGFNWTTGAGGGHVYLRSGANETQASAGYRDGGYIIFQTGSRNNTFIERARMLDNGNFGLGTTAPTAQLDLTQQIRIRGGNPGVGKVLISDANGLASWGQGMPDVINGLNITANTIRLGGPLITGTTITQNTWDMVYDLNSTGDFHIRDNGVNHFTVQDNGNTVFGGDVEWRDENTAGTVLAQLIDDGNDGRFLLQENGNVSIDLDANSQFIFNEQGLDRNFRVESNTNANMLFVDAGQNRVGIGTGAPAANLHVEGGRVEFTGAADATGTTGSGVLEIGNTLRLDGNEIITNNNLTFYINENNNGDVQMDNGTFFLDASTSRLGIGTMAPDAKLDVFGNIELSGGSREVRTQVMTANGKGFSLTMKASDNQNNGFNAQSGGDVILQGGKGFNWNQGAGGGHVIIRSGPNETAANPGFRDGGYIIFQTGSANSTYIERARMLDNGNLGVGTTAPGFKLQVGNNGDGSVARANAWTTFSDRRWKTKIVLITNALDKLHKINGYTYKWKEGADTSTQVGVIAQEIEAVLPEAVRTDENGYKSVDYGKLSALLIEAVKEQQLVITDLNNKLKIQSSKINTLDSNQKTLESRLLKIENAIAQ